jgi:nucleotide-binding universal stress UspA family protein
MAYKTILIHCNDKRRINGILAPAVKMASTFGSHVIGLSVVPPVSVISTGALEAPPVIVDAHCELYRQDVAPMRQQFEAALAGHPATGEWRDLDAGVYGVVDVVVEHGRTADLIVALQTDTDWPLTEWLDVADTVVLESGRPVLLIPNGRSSDRVGSRVLVAWNGRREAARAAFDALPLLQRASAVRVVSINESHGDNERPGSDICQSLVRHGVKVGASERIAAAVGAGPALMAEADAFDADLVVMGCYGHSRLREFVFGGATRHFLQKMRVPVLMSH